MKTSLLILPLLVITPSAMAVDCAQYARVAVTQFAASQQLDCGFSGARWQNSYDNHFQWCQAMDEDFVFPENWARNDEIAACIREQRGPLDCEDYASLAVKQFRAATVLGCVPEGARWQESFNNHYRWCQTAPRAHRESENYHRQEWLVECALTLERW